MIVGYREYCHHIIKNSDKTIWLMKKEIIDLVSSSGAKPFNARVTVGFGRPEGETSQAIGAFSYG